MIIDIDPIYPWHQSTWQQLQRPVLEQRLPHALLLQGSDGLGKDHFATQFAASLLCQTAPADRPQQAACGDCAACRLLQAGTHPDLYQLEPMAAKKSSSKKPMLSIRIDDIRELCGQLAQTSQFGGYRIAIIDDAHKMTREAANSLLKTLEEPGGGVLIMLITSRPAALPATIRSRCQQLRFPKPDGRSAIDWMQQHCEQSIALPRLQQALHQAAGSPLAAMRMLDDEDLTSLLAKAMLARRDDGDMLEYAARLVAFDRAMILALMLSWAADAIKIRLGAASAGDVSGLANVTHRQALSETCSSISLTRLFWFYDQVHHQLALQSIAINEQLLWENLLLSWKQL